MQDPPITEIAANRIYDSSVLPLVSFPGFHCTKREGDIENRFLSPWIPRVFCSPGQTRKMKDYGKGEKMS